MNADIAEKLKMITGPSNVFLNEDMGKHTTFKAGGCADVFVTPQSCEEATEIVRLLLAQGVPYFVMGNGSNLLVSDEGYRGCIVRIGKGMDDIAVNGTQITAGAGALLSKVAYAAYEAGLTGLEFASGIPGSLGGGVVMNAGAYGGELKDVIRSVTLFDTVSGQITRLSSDEMEFGYRKSIVRSHPYIVFEARMELLPGDKEQIKGRMDELAEARRTKQPLEYPSAGSTFKRPEGYFAGKLIEETDLKGFSVGDAMVSEKHCGFVINKGNACADDIIELIRIIRKRVYEKHKVMLEPEVIILGENTEL